MIHYTLNTAHVRHSPRSEVADEVIDQMSQFLAPGQYTLPDPFALVVPETERGLVFALHHGTTPLVACGVADTALAAAEVWPIVERAYFLLPHSVFPGKDVPSCPYPVVDWKEPHKPESLPWLAVAIQIPFDCWGSVGFSTENWLPDFERCLAWAWLENKHPV